MRIKLNQSQKLNGDLRLHGAIWEKMMNRSKLLRREAVELISWKLPASSSSLARSIETTNTDVREREREREMDLLPRNTGNGPGPKI